MTVVEGVSKNIKKSYRNKNVVSAQVVVCLGLASQYGSSLLVLCHWYWGEPYITRWDGIKRWLIFAVGQWLTGIENQKDKPNRVTFK